MSAPQIDQQGSTDPEQGRDALPTDWDAMWGVPVDPERLGWRHFKLRFAELCAEVPLLDHRQIFGTLVGSKELRGEPVHRWFTYKEGFSPYLLSRVLDVLEEDGPAQIADVFGGVGTTALAGQSDPRVSEVRSLEYSPWAHFAGAVKLSWPNLNPASLRKLIGSALDYPAPDDLCVPSLSSFSNPRVFDQDVVQQLLAVRNHVRRLPVTTAERGFFELGLGAVIEDLSLVMKDGRALRVRGDRRRRASSLVSSNLNGTAGARVHHYLRAQWLAMVDDLEALSTERGQAAGTPVEHVRGDARAPAASLLASGEAAFPEQWADLSLFSPPYLNCLDYTELYKLELWMLEHVTDSEQFRSTRQGTLRSHPSVRFSPRDSFAGLQDDPAVRLIAEVSQWLCENSARRDIGPVVLSYFEDMYEVFCQQAHLLKPGGTMVCVVANSTFSGRERDESGSRRELWRMPILTDVLLAHMARLAGLQDVVIWGARSLRARNVRAGSARESLVVARRPQPA